MSLLTVAEYVLRQPEAAGLDPDVLQAIIDGNETLVRMRVGVLDNASREITLAGYPASVILLPERAAEITKITEQIPFGGTEVELADDDFRLSPAGTAIERVIDGTHPRDSFEYRIIVEYVPFDALALWKNIIFQLCEADRSFTPGIQSQTLGDYSESHSSSATGQGSITAVKEDILGQLAPPLPVFS